MAISTGDMLPDANLLVLTSDGPGSVSLVGKDQRAQSRNLWPARSLHWHVHNGSRPKFYAYQGHVR